MDHRRPAGQRHEPRRRQCGTAQQARHGEATARRKLREHPFRDPRKHRPARDVAAEGIQKGIASWETALAKLSEVTGVLAQREKEAAGSLLKVEGELSEGVRFLRKLASPEKA